MERNDSEMLHFPTGLHHINPQSCVKWLSEGRSLALLRGTPWDIKTPDLDISALEEQD